METQNPINLQHNALESLIKDTYGLNLKSFLIDAAEIVEQLSDSSDLIEALWHIASILPMDPNRP